jgi:hypothetical protein
MTLHQFTLYLRQVHRILHYLTVVWYTHHGTIFFVNNYPKGLGIM